MTGLNKKMISGCLEIIKVSSADTYTTRMIDKLIQLIKEGTFNE